MTISERDRRALIILGVVAVLGGIYYWFSSSTPTPSGDSVKAGVPVAADRVDRANVDLTEKRLESMRRQSATLPGKEGVLKQVSRELADREKGLIPGDTAEQAQAQLLQVVKRVAQQQTPPLEVGQVELGRPRTFGSAYGQVSVSISVTCHIEQLVNFLAALGDQPELAATEEIRFGAANAKQKTLPVRLTISGLVARRLVPKQRGLPEL
jgi:hypothetical protein